MTLASGSKLGPYEIVGQIGAGGMGEVYRAKDPRLGRDVAIKVLPASFSQDADRLRRFEQEAKAAGLLNHPNITIVYDIGSHDGAPYVVQELLEGETLRSELASGRFAPRKAIDCGIQIAHGLAAAHDKGIVHRDLKPENVFVTKDGRLKILDFGLAKLTQGEAGSGPQTNMPTATAGTEPGVVMGTLGYMSPEQIKGKPADARSDIFAFGAILYEMLAGRRAFHADSAGETMAAILKEDPPDLSITNQSISPGLERIVHHCIEKNPERRFHSAHDLAFDLEALSGTSGTPASGAPPGLRTRRPSSLLLAALPALLAGLLIGALATRSSRTGPPTFQRLTFRRGTIWTARFAPDGQTIVYGAAWEQNPLDVFLTRAESPESRPFGLKDASLFGVSPTGELAVMLGARTAWRGYERSGTLARIPLAGGSPHALLDDVRYADWGSDGKELMVERRVSGKHRIELPIGTVLYESSIRMESPRVSRDGKRVAFFQGDALGDIAIRVVDRAGKVVTIQHIADWWNLAWSPDGSEIWYSAPEPGSAPGIASFQAVSLAGKRRLLLRIPGTPELQDVAPDGRVLFGQTHLRWQTDGIAPGETAPRELTWLDGSTVRDITPDGKFILMQEDAEGGGPNQSIYLRSMGGEPPTLIGEGIAHALSPDGKWVLANVPGQLGKLILLPTGPGSPRPVDLAGVPAGVAAGLFFPDGKRLLVESHPSEGPSRVYVVPLDGEKTRPIAPAGFAMPPFGNPVSPSGDRVALVGAGEVSYLVPTDGGAPAPIAGLEPGEFPIQWSGDAGFVYVHRGGAPPARVWRVELATGRRELLREISPADRAGVFSIERIFLTPDGRGIAYCYRHNLSDLYLVRGLK